MTISILISALFLTGAVCAMGVIATTLRAYWPVVAALRNAGEIEPEQQEVRIVTLAIDVRISGHVLRGDFTGRSSVPVRVLQAAA